MMAMWAAGSPRHATSNDKPVTSLMTSSFLLP